MASRVACCAGLSKLNFLPENISNGQRTEQNRATRAFYKRGPGG